MYEKVYIILAHKNPLQLKRLINKLKTPDSYFYIHLDIKSDINEFEAAISSERVVFISKRENCIWGDFSLVKATLALVEEVLKHHTKGHCVLLSGQDYPLKTAVQISDYFSQNVNKNFISLKRIENMWSKVECENRTRCYRINRSYKKGDYLLFRYPNKKALSMLIHNKLSLRTCLQLFKPRKIDLELYGGSQWWAFNIETLKKMYEYIEKRRRKLFRYFKHTNCADEIFFHTIIKELQKSDQTILLEESVTYINWQPQDSFSPVIFTKQDFDMLCRQPANHLFARKFDMRQDTGILDMLDWDATNVRMMEF